MKYLQRIVLAAVLVATARDTNAQSEESGASSEKTTFTPKVHHPNIQGVTLFAQNPEIVTPVGIAVVPMGGCLCERIIRTNETQTTKAHRPTGSWSLRTRTTMSQQCGRAFSCAKYQGFGTAWSGGIIGYHSDNIGLNPKLVDTENAPLLHSVDHFPARNRRNSPFPNRNSD